MPSYYTERLAPNVSALAMISLRIAAEYLGRKPSLCLACMDSLQMGFRDTRYTPQFWEHRLEWFEIQAAHHLIGEIDYQTTGNGTIVCKDGFRATTADRPSLEK